MNPRCIKEKRLAPRNSIVAWMNPLPPLLSMKANCMENLRSVAKALEGWSSQRTTLPNSKPQMSKFKVSPCDPAVWWSFNPVGWQNHSIFLIIKIENGHRYNGLIMIHQLCLMIVMKDYQTLQRRVRYIEKRTMQNSLHDMSKIFKSFLDRKSNYFIELWFRIER